jgi:Family of unknown function (DUF7002)
VTEAEFVTRYPRVYHVGEVGSWTGIQRHGLLSVSALLDLFGLQGNERERLETCKRKDAVMLEHPDHGRVILRDQKPLSEEKLAACLTDMTSAEWIRLLNGRVFFWLSERTLDSLLGGKEYRDRSHDVIVFDSRRLLERHGGRAFLSPINSGATLRKPARRGSTTFRPLAIYDILEKRSPVELAILDGVRDAADLVFRVDERRGS